MSEESMQGEIDLIGETQSQAKAWLLGIASTLLVAFILAIATLLIQVSKIDTVIAERFTAVQFRLDGFERTLNSVAEKTDGKFDALETRVRSLENRLERIDANP